MSLHVSVRDRKAEIVACKRNFIFYKKQLPPASQGQLENMARLKER
jgi:hypothetical protein